MQNVVEYYNQCAADYRLIWGTKRNLSIHMGFCPNGKIGHDASLLKMNEVLAKKARLSRRDQVIDLGCGVGGSAIWLAQNVGCRVTGVDINDSFLSYARHHAKERGLDGLVRFHQADFCHTTFPEESFDVAWALESSCYAQSKLAFLGEAKRLLKPGGRLVVADGFAVEEGDKLRTWLAGWAVPNLATPSMFESYLVRQGFINISYENVTANVLASSGRLYRYARLLYPLGKLLELIRVRNRVQTANILSAIGQRETLRKGLWQYGIFTAEKAG